jgi:hypothetical protein
MQSVYLVFKWDPDRTSRTAQCVFTSKTEANLWIESQRTKEQERIIDSMDKIYKRYISALKEGRSVNQEDFGTLATHLERTKATWELGELYMYDNAGEASV